MDIQVYASGSKGNCYRLSDEQTTILLECGIPCKEIMKHIRFQIRSISGVLLTHNHMDHAKSAKDLAGYGINIYSSEGTFRALGLSGHRYKIVKALEPFHIGTFDIYPFDVQHDVPEPLGYVITSQVTGERLRELIKANERVLKRDYSKEEYYGGLLTKQKKMVQ